MHDSILYDEQWLSSSEQIRRLFHVSLITQPYGQRLLTITLIHRLTRFANSSSASPCADLFPFVSSAAALRHLLQKRVFHTGIAQIGDRVWVYAQTSIHAIYKSIARDAPLATSFPSIPLA